MLSPWRSGAGEEGKNPQCEAIVGVPTEPHRSWLRIKVGGALFLSVCTSIAVAVSVSKSHSVMTTSHLVGDWRLGKDFKEMSPSTA
jgi:hypothetical protein